MARVRELGKALLNNGFVFPIRDAEPRGVRGQHLAGCQFAADQLAHGKWDVAFTFELFAVLLKKLFE